ncbi:MAG: Gfo/Idh/MocA family oxidoreductase [Anaeromyxobacter sp.]
MAGRVRVGVIGTSWWAELEHLPGLRSRDDVEVTALCGRDPARLAEVAGRQGVPHTFTDWHALIRSGRVDAVVIALPNALHHPVAMAALQAGLHVICEKPLALDLARARELAETARAAGRATLTFFTHRQVGAVAQLKRLVERGALGQPVHVSASYFTASHLKPGKAAAWRMMRAESGTGVLGDLGSHLVDLVRWLLGDLTRVSAHWLTVTPERDGVVTDADESVSFLAQLACGAQGVFQASKLVAGRGNQQRLELHGTAASLLYEAEPGYDPTFEGRLWLGRPDRSALEPVPLDPDSAAARRRARGARSRLPAADRSLLPSRPRGWTGLARLR